MQIRVPINLREWLEEKTKSSGRSLNAELMELMRQAKEKEELKT